MDSSLLSPLSGYSPFLMMLIANHFSAIAALRRNLSLRNFSCNCFFFIERLKALFFPLMLIFNFLGDGYPFRSCPT